MAAFEVGVREWGATGVVPTVEMSQESSRQFSTVRNLSVKPCGCSLAAGPHHKRRISQEVCHREVHHVAGGHED